MKVEYKYLEEKEIDCALFSHFIRHQVVTKCWRKIDGTWCIKDIGFVDDWKEEEYEFLVKLSVEPEHLGTKKQYLDLSSIHVSEDMRGCGIGKELFHIAKQWAGAHGAKKLYISAHSAVESQAFYKAMGCVEAEEYDKEHVKKKPCDCQLECEL